MTNAVRGEAVSKWPRVVILALMPLPLAFLAIGWCFTAPLETDAITREAERITGLPATPEPDLEVKIGNLAPAAPVTPPAAAATSIEWPLEEMSGKVAKSFMLNYMLAIQTQIAAIDGYTALFTKQERVRGELGPETMIKLKVRHKPFSVYMRFLNQEQGREIVYSEGRFDNQLVAHNGGLARRLLPRLKLDPKSTLALANNRHPVTDAGLNNLVNKLVGYRYLDIDDEHATTKLDRITDSENRLWYRAQHDHTEYRPNRPFARAVIMFDPETRLPCRFEGYEWPESFESRAPEELLLGESYRYDNLDFDAPLTDLDFDPANPDYEFTRF